MCLGLFLGRESWEFCVGLMLIGKGEVGVVSGPNVYWEGRGGSCVWA